MILMDKYIVFKSYILNFLKYLVQFCAFIFSVFGSHSLVPKIDQDETFGGKLNLIDLLSRIYLEKNCTPNGLL